MWQTKISKMNVYRNEYVVYQPQCHMYFVNTSLHIELKHACYMDTVKCDWRTSYISATSSAATSARILKVVTYSQWEVRHLNSCPDRSCHMGKKVLCIFHYLYHPNHYHTPHFGAYATSLPITIYRAGESDVGSDYHDLSLCWKGSRLSELQRVTINSSYYSNAQVLV